MKFFDYPKHVVSRRGFLRLAFISPCLLTWSGENRLFAEDPVPGVVEPTPEEIDAAIQTLNTTHADNVTEPRRAATETIQRSVDRLRAREFTEYFKSSGEDAARWENERGVLHYLNVSFDKVMAEMTATPVPEGNVVFWHVYNMGYIIKTPTQTIAIDIKHRRAPELVPYIDFLLVTHKHGDHYTDEFCEAVAAAGKPVVSNFIDNPWKTPPEGREYEFGDSAIRVRLVDHNDKLRHFVSTYEIDCGPKSGNFVIFHVGDACNVNQIKAEKPVDVFIPHLAVGLDVPKAVNETLRPANTLLSHILELGHAIDKWRWSYEYGYNICKKCANDSVVLPVWGEKLSFSK
ncbi:MAG: MBL fold metallo-hydrolase [Thermoguttaceae bacterium]|nr:MBL fold metallo-hydrolase [Thermoguttaceae bacterium]